MNKRNCSLVFVLLINTLVFSQYPDIKNYYDGYFNYQCVNSTTEDTSGVQTEAFVYKYNTEIDLIDTLFYYVIDGRDSFLILVPFSYFPSQKYFTRQLIVEGELLDSEKFCYNEIGTLTVDSCFDQTNTLCYTSTYVYLPDGKLSVIARKTVPGSSISAADSTLWIYSSSGKIDSVKNVYWDYNELEWIDIFVPEYDSSGRIAKALYHTGPISQPLVPSICKYFYENNSIFSTHTIRHGQRFKFIRHKNHLMCTGVLNKPEDVKYELYDSRGKRLYQSNYFSVSDGHSSFIIPFDDRCLNSSGKYILKLNTQTTEVVYPFVVLK